MDKNNSEFFLGIKIDYVCDEGKIDMAGLHRVTDLRTEAKRRTRSRYVY